VLGGSGCVKLPDILTVFGGSQCGCAFKAGWKEADPGRFRKGDPVNLNPAVDLTTKNTKFTKKSPFFWALCTAICPNRSVSRGFLVQTQNAVLHPISVLLVAALPRCALCGKMNGHRLINGSMNREKRSKEQKVTIFGTQPFPSQKQSKTNQADKDCQLLELTPAC
jgi:hypothetical protein